MSATRTEAVTASEHLGMLNSSLEFVNQKLHNNLTRPSRQIHLPNRGFFDIISICMQMQYVIVLKRGRNYV